MAHNRKGGVEETRWKQPVQNADRHMLRRTPRPLQGIWQGKEVLISKPQTAKSLAKIMLDRRAGTFGNMREVD